MPAKSWRSKGEKSSRPRTAKPKTGGANTVRPKKVLKIGLQTGKVLLKGDEHKNKLNQIYNENLKIGVENLQKEDDIDRTMKHIRDLQKRKKELQWNDLRQKKLEKAKKEKADEKEHLEY